MYFLVFAAFAIVLSIPSGGLPWKTIEVPALTYGMVAGQALLAGIVAWGFARAVRTRLDSEPAWLPGAQRLFAQGTFAVRVVLAFGLAGSIYLTDWAQRVRSVRWLQSFYGLDELAMLVPFFTAILLGWVMLYPADRAIRRVHFDQQLRAGILPRPVWRLGSYLSFMFRQHVLIIAVPMVPIVIANDLVSYYSRSIRHWTKVAWGGEAVLVAVAGLVFLVAPLMLRHIWHTRVLPPGELRDRLERMCKRIGLTYRRILIWESDGMVVNAAVMGLFRPVRYILLSDGLLEMMDDRKIEAVFGHEAGHVKKRHIQYYLLFAILSMFIVGGLMELAMRARAQWPGYFPPLAQFEGYLQVAAMALVVLVWGMGFGAVSRRFEWQADLFGAQSVTPSESECNRPCVLHGTATPFDPSGEKGPGVPPGGVPVCATAATTFADALHRIADLNGIPIDARSWRHSSIANRKQLLHQYAADPQAAARLERSVLIIKAVLLAGTAIGLVVATWLYWPR
ncbi:MAG TPA: M48 family metallopeptidase [Phycisphaerae bacterium]|nr:M48 family metalloprotease [Phycisphaerae bacterium]HOB75007.1 M48 family metallopeptidase [Phycisphaerae bacterium]HOJ55085.1 M48 family metallopeptidase [Phycisphaerae bacterium]HOL26864.1 M48 family metallopeptidase [Phycisphaerae bacterium]HPP20819.1 M48 family metallopeptidase [Phycisphaerae bacterium]